MSVTHQKYAVSTETGLPPSESSEPGTRAREGFRPEFTHQVFDDERIQGYGDEGDVAIQIVYSATSLHFLVKIETRDKDSSRYHC